MISRDEFSILQQKLVDWTNKREEFSIQVEAKKKELEELNSINQKIAALKEAIANDEEVQNRETSEAAAEVHNFKPESFLGTKWNIFDRDEKKLTKLETTVTQLQEKLERVSKSYEELILKDQSNKDTLKELARTAEDADKKLKKLQQLSTKIPPAGLVLHQLEDLEDTYIFLKKSNQSAISLIPELKKKEEDLTDKLQDDTTELEMVTVDLQTLSIEDSQHKAEKNNRISQLSQIHNDLQIAHNNAQVESADSDHEISVNNELSNKYAKELTEIRKEILNIKKQMANFEDQKKAVHSDNTTLLQKKKQLCDQLEKRLNEERQILIEKQSNTSEVQDLTNQLEKHWIDHEKMVQQHEKKKKELQNAMDDLDRKKIAISEINSKWPIGKVKTKPGMNELNHMYEIALVQNRKMAEDLNSLQEELNVQEEMNKTLNENLDFNSTSSDLIQDEKKEKDADVVEEEEEVD